MHTSYILTALVLAAGAHVADQLTSGGNNETVLADNVGLPKVPKLCKEKKMKWGKLKKWLSEQGDDWRPKLGDDTHGTIERCKFVKSCNIRCSLKCDTDTHTFIEGKSRLLEFQWDKQDGWVAAPAKIPHSFCEVNEKVSTKKTTGSKQSEVKSDESPKETSYAASHLKWVPEVKQNFEEETLAKLNQLVSKLFQTSYTYLGMASFYGRADVALPGFQKLMTDLWSSEQSYSRDVIDYINMRGGYVSLQDIPRTDSLDQLMDKLVDQSASHRTGEKGLEIALETTKDVNEMLLATIEAAMNAKPRSDPHVKHFLEHGMLVSKTETIKKLSDMLGQLQSFKSPEDYAVGEYVLDSEELL